MIQKDWSNASHKFFTQPDNNIFMLACWNSFRTLPKKTNVIHYTSYKKRYNHPFPISYHSKKITFQHEQTFHLRPNHPILVWYGTSTKIWKEMSWQIDNNQSVWRCHTTNNACNRRFALKNTIKCWWNFLSWVTINA